MEKDQLRLCVSSRFFLKLSLIWPPKNEQLHPTARFYIILGFFLIGPVSLLLVLMIFHLIEAFKVGEDVSEDLSAIATDVQVGLLMLLYTMKQKDIAMLLRDLSDFRKFGKPPRFEEVNRKLEHLVKIIGFNGFCFPFCYNLYKVATIPECQKFRKFDEACGTMLPTRSPFEVNDWILINFVFWVIFFFAKVPPMISCQILEIACNIKLRIDHLNSMLVECFQGDFEADKKRLFYCIRYHNFLIRTCDVLKDKMTNIMFVYLITLGIICGFIENQFLKHHDLLPIIHLSGWLPVPFIACLGGQVLIDSSFSVGYAAYSSRWYDADIRLRKVLILLIMRSQKPLVVSTGAFDVLSLALFLKMMKMSYSIITLLE